MKLRRDWAIRIAIAAEQGNPIRCRRTGTPITPNTPWDLGHAPGHDVHLAGHNTHDLHPELASANRAAGNHLRHGHQESEHAL